MAKTKPAGAQRSLLRFAQDKRREGCSVCALDAAVRDQLAEARSKKITRPVQLEWLQKEIGVKISDQELTSHNNGRHDVQDA